MSATITVVADVIGNTFTAKLKKYADSSTYYVLDGVRKNSGPPTPFRFVIDPTTYILPAPGQPSNATGWAAGYIALVDAIFS